MRKRTHSVISFSAYVDMPREQFVLGYDLNDYMTQISYYELHSSVPETITSDEDVNRLGIPTVLSKRYGVSQWDFGSTAKKLAEAGEAILVGKVLSFAAAGAKLELEGEAYDATELLILFVRRSLHLLSNIMTPDQVEQMIITVSSLSGRMVDVMERIASSLPIPRDKIIIQTYEESIFYYLLHQSEDLWEHDVTLFDYSGNNLVAYNMRMNRRTEPVVSFVDREDFADILQPGHMFEDFPDTERKQKLDEMLVQKVHTYFAGKSVGTVFLLGESFEGGWCDKTVKYLCLGKRVFQGRNLYSKGACYCGRDKLSPGPLNKAYIFLGKDKLKMNLGMNMNVYGKKEYMAIADAGENWYDSGVTYEFILGDEPVVPLILTPLDGKRPQEINIELNGIPQRPPRASRVQMKVTFISESELRIDISDMGFGEFYPPTQRTWEKVITME